MRAIDLIGMQARRLAPVIITIGYDGNPIFDRIAVDNPVIINSVNDKWINVSPIVSDDSSCMGDTILDVREYDDDKWVDANYTEPPISENIIKNIFNSIGNSEKECAKSTSSISSNPSIPSFEKGVEVVKNNDLSIVLRSLNKIFNNFKTKDTFNIYSLETGSLNFIHSFTFKRLKDGGYSISESPLKFTEPDIIVISGKFNAALTRLINCNIVDIYCVHEILCGDDLCFSPITFSDIENILEDKKSINVYVRNKVYEFMCTNGIYSFTIVDGFDTKNAYILYPDLAEAIYDVPGYRGISLSQFDN